MGATATGVGAESDLRYSLNPLKQSICLLILHFCVLCYFFLQSILQPVNCAKHATLPCLPESLYYESQSDVL